MIKENKQDLAIGKKCLVGEPEFYGIWTYVGKDELNHIFAFTKGLSRKITELYIPKKGIIVDIIEYNNKEIPRVLSLGNEYYLDTCNLNKDRKRFFELAEKVGIIN